MTAHCKRVLVTGGTGFVGGAVVQALTRKSGVEPVAAVRARLTDDGNPLPAHHVVLGNLDEHTPWGAALAGVDAVIHTAARVHVTNDQAADPLSKFRRVNVSGTLNLARQAAAAGVKRLVFVSSIKVNGERTLQGKRFKPDDACMPQDPYGLSKYEAEVGLRAVAAETGLEVTIVRPPLVYGPGVKANFAAMVSWLSRGVPLPLGAVVHNRRSLVALDNLVDLLLVCATHPAAANQTFLVSDDEDVSTADLLRRIGQTCKAAASASGGAGIGCRCRGQGRYGAALAQQLAAGHFQNQASAGLATACVFGRRLKAHCFCLYIVLFNKPLFLF